MKLTKTKMKDLFSVFKRVMLISDKFVIVNDCIIPIRNVKNGSHLIHYEVPDINTEIVYESLDNIYETMKLLEDKKGIKHIEFECTDQLISVIIDGEPFVLFKSVYDFQYYREISFTEKRNYYLDSPWQELSINDLERIRASKVVNVMDGDNVIRVSKNIFPCIGANRKIDPVNFRVSYTVRDDNVILFLVKYNIFEAIHAYSFMGLGL